MKWSFSYRCQEMRRASLPITIIILIIAIVSELNVPSAVPRLTPGTEGEITPSVLRKEKNSPGDISQTWASVQKDEAHPEARAA